MSVTRKIVILGVGGTIAGQGPAQGGGVGYQAGQIGVDALVAPVIAGISQALDGPLSFEMEQITQLDSKDMDVNTWQRLASSCTRWLARQDVTGLVITHGTDTLEETAWFLQCVLQPTKPVVMTCAMRPATALSADGPANLRDALYVAGQSQPGVWVVTAGEVHAAHAVRKVHPYRVNAFTSGPQGPAAWIEEGCVRWVNPSTGSYAQSTSVPIETWRQNESEWPWVEIITSTAAANPRMVEALVNAGVQGLVIAATGNGSVHQALLHKLQKAQQAGIWVWRTTRCEQGQLVLARGETDARASTLSPVKARISMMLELLQRGDSRFAV